MIYAEVHTYANKDVAERQKESIAAYAAANAIQIEKWLLFDKTDRREQLKKPENGDVLLTAKLFRLGGDVHEIMSTLQELLGRGVVICSCEDELCLGDDASSSVMFQSFKIAGDVAKDVRVRLTQEALEMRRQSGKKLGRPSGAANKGYKLDDYAREMRRLFAQGVSASEISRRVKVDINTLRRYLKLHPELRPEKTV